MWPHPFDLLQGKEALGLILIYRCLDTKTSTLSVPLDSPKLQMVLTDRQREDLHAGIHEYLISRPGGAFQRAAAALAEADPKARAKTTNNVGKTPLLEKKWTAIPRLQKKVLELERTVAQNAKIHAHRTGQEASTNGVPLRRMLPRLPCSHTLQGHSAVVTSVQVHPVFTVVVSGSEDGTIKVTFTAYILLFFS